MTWLGFPLAGDLLQRSSPGAGAGGVSQGSNERIDPSTRSFVGSHIKRKAATHQGLRIQETLRPILTIGEWCSCPRAEIESQQERNLRCGYLLQVRENFGNPDVEIGLFFFA